MTKKDSRVSKASNAYLKAAAPLIEDFTDELRGGPNTPEYARRILQKYVARYRGPDKAEFKKDLAMAGLLELVGRTNRERAEAILGEADMPTLKKRAMRDLGALNTNNISQDCYL